MLKYCVAVLCLLATCQARSTFSITEAQVSQRLSSPFGVVEGIVPCGGVGRIVETRVTDCTRVPCQLVATRQYTIAIDFVPAERHEGLDLTITLIHLGAEHTVVDGSVPDSAVEAGLTYTFTYTITVTGFQTGLSDLKVEIAGQRANQNEVCGLAGIVVVPP